jgi:hypothetical protein
MKFCNFEYSEGKKLEANALLIDMEPKVINECLLQSKCQMRFGLK